MTYEQTQAVQKEMERTERRGVLKRTWFVGATLLFMLAAQLVLSFCVAPLIAKAEGNMDLSVFHRLLYYGLYNALYCGMLLFPALVMALCFRQKPWFPRELRRPMGALEGLLIVLFGLGFCVLANFITNYWLNFVGLFGIEPFYGDYHATADPLTLLLNLFTYAVLPAVVEELVFRGWFLSAMQPCGERSALWLSAVLFALTHGNLTQIPFALLLGLLFGWIYLSTGRLWPVMLLHFLNNGLSVVMDYLAVFVSEGTAASLQYAAFAVMVIVGLTAGVLLALHPSFASTVRPLTDRRHLLSGGWRAGLLWGNPGILIYAVAYLGITVLAEVVRIWM